MVYNIFNPKREREASITTGEVAMGWLNYWYLAEAIEHDEPTKKPGDKEIAEALGITVKELNRTGAHQARDDEMEAGMNPERAENKANKGK